MDAFKINLRIHHRFVWTIDEEPLNFGSFRSGSKNSNESATDAGNV